MFRKMRRFRQQVPEEVCRSILQTEKRAVLAVNGDEGYPYAIPINFFYEPGEHRIYFHGAKEGHKVDAIRRCNKVCVTLWNTGYQTEGSWEWNVTSVVVFGRAVLVEDSVVSTEMARKLACKYYPTPEEAEGELSAIDRMQLFAVEMEHMTGKLVNEK